MASPGKDMLPVAGGELVHVPRFVAGETSISGGGGLTDSRSVWLLAALQQAPLQLHFHRLTNYLFPLLDFIMGRTPLAPAAEGTIGPVKNIIAYRLMLEAQVETVLAMEGLHLCRSRRIGGPGPV